MSEEKFLTLRAVIDRVAIKKSSIYKYMNEGKFPLPVKIGARALWPESAIQKWMQAQIERSQTGGLADER